MHTNIEPILDAQAGHTASTGTDSVWSLAAFWIVAFIGASLFAAVLIAPRWEERQALRKRVLYQSIQCSYLGDVNDHYRRVIEAFKNDREFNEEVARFALGYVSPNEERVAAPVQNWARPKPPHLELQAPDPW